MAEIHYLTPTDAPDASSLDYMLEVLARLTERVRKGEVESFAILSHESGGQLKICATKTNSRHVLLAGTVYLQNELAKESDGRDP